MTPNVHTFIMNHEQTLKYLHRCIKVDSIAMCDMLIVLHIRRSFVVMPNHRLGLTLPFILIFIILPLLFQFEFACFVLLWFLIFHISYYYYLQYLKFSPILLFILIIINNCNDIIKHVSINDIYSVKVSNKVPFMKLIYLVIQAHYT
jgi:hypothetical protein